MCVCACMRVHWLISLIVLCFFFLHLFDLSRKFPMGNIIIFLMTEQMNKNILHILDSIGMISPQRCLWHLFSGDKNQFELIEKFWLDELLNNIIMNKMHKRCHIKSIIILESWIRTLKTVKCSFLYIYLYRVCWVHTNCRTCAVALKL